MLCVLTDKLSDTCEKQHDFFSFLPMKDKNINAPLFQKKGITRQYSTLFVQFSRVIDALFIFLCLWAVIFCFSADLTKEYLIITFAAICSFEFFASFFELYRSWRVVRLRREFVRILLCWFASSLIVVFIIYIFSENLHINNLLVSSWILITPIVLMFFRVLVRMSLRYVRAYGFDRRVIGFVGATDTALYLYESIKKYPWMGLDIVGFFDDRIHSKNRSLPVSREKIIGDTTALLEMANQGKVDIIYITLPMKAEARIKKLIEYFSNTTVSIFYTPSIFSFDLLHARWDTIDDQPIISVIDSPFEGAAGLLKRLEDLVVSIIALLIIAIPMLLISITIKCTSKGPVFFKQTRYGLNGKKFKIWKFRTMKNHKRSVKFVQATKNDARITPFGMFLRRMSLDELPQFINVLKGDMSVVGPRPHPVELNEQYRKIISRYMIRHKVKPGITGLAQIKGFRGETESLDKMEGRTKYDLQYIRQWSLLLDISIIYQTMAKGFFGPNTY